MAADALLADVAERMAREKADQALKWTNQGKGRWRSSAGHFAERVGKSQWAITQPGQLFPTSEITGSWNQVRGSIGMAPPSATSGPGLAARGQLPGQLSIDDALAGRVPSSASRIHPSSPLSRAAAMPAPGYKPPTQGGRLLPAVYKPPTQGGRLLPAVYKPPTQAVGGGGAARAAAAGAGGAGGGGGGGGGAAAAAGAADDAAAATGRFAGVRNAMNSPAGRYAKGFGLRGLGAMVAYPVIDQLLQNVDTESGPGNYIEAALQGAAGGYTVGGPWGAAIGAVANPITDAIFGKSATEAIADAEIPILSGFFGGPFMPEQVDPQLQSLVDAGFASDPEDAKRRLAKMEMYQSVMGLQPGPQLFNAVFGDMQQIADPALERAKVVGQMMQPFTDSYRRSTEAFDAQLANIGGMSPGVAQAYQAWGPLNSALSNQYADIMGSNAMAQALANAANNPDMTGVADSGLLDALLGG